MRVGIRRIRSQPELNKQATRHSVWSAEARSYQHYRFPGQETLWKFVAGAGMFTGQFAALGPADQEEVHRERSSAPWPPAGRRRVATKFPTPAAYMVGAALTGSKRLRHSLDQPMNLSDLRRNSFG